MKHIHADHPDETYFMYLMKGDEAPSGEYAAYENLLQHLEYGDELISNTSR